MTGTPLRARPWLTAALAGVLLAAALPPMGFLPGLFGLTMLAHILHGAPARRALPLATLGAFTYSVFGLYWVGIAFFADAEKFGLLAVPAVLGLCALLAGTFGVMAALVALPRWRSAPAFALALAVAWILAELIRAGTFIQFPWNPLSIVWAVSSLTLQPIAWLGTYGLGLLTAAACFLAAPCLEPGGRRRWAGLLAPALLVAFILLAGAWRLAEAPVTEPGGPLVRLVQGNVPQGLKWQPGQRGELFRRHLELSARPADPPPAVVVWPESAVPYQLEQDERAREYIAQVLAPGSYAVVGGDRFLVQNDQIVAASNSMFALDAQGRVDMRYDKTDLVPFGEFTPFRPFFGRLGFAKLVDSMIDFSPGSGRQLVGLPSLPAFSPLICYEAVFPGKAAPHGARPAWLLNITNDAWFGTSSGPYQHLAMARMRAVEEGLPLARAANTGVSAMIDAHGRVLARLPLNETGILDVRLPAALAEASPAQRAGPWLLWALLGLTAAASLVVERRARAAAS